MYITKVKIDNIRIIADFEMELDKEEAPGWHVILGDNGSGKSTFVRAVSLALIGNENATALRQDWSSWIGGRASLGKVSVSVRAPDSNLDKWTGKGKTSPSTSIKPQVSFTREKKSPSPSIKFEGNLTGRTIWGDGYGWYSVAFGPFRRFRGGDNKYDKLYHSHPKLAAHLSAFGEDVALSEALEWVKNYQFQALEGNKTAKNLNDGLLNFINASDLLPHGAQLTAITSKGIMVDNGAFTQVPVEEMSDGYRSVLAMTFDILRAMDAAYGTDRLTKELRTEGGKVNLPGVILIDEIDAHLHPAWQQRIGHWFTKHFPKIQFFVTTHSPIICQAAEKGSIWRLAAPGSEEESGRVEGTELGRLVYGNVLEALSTDYFGSDVAQSKSSHEKLDKLARLNIKALNGGLTPDEETERTELRKCLPTEASRLEG